MTDGTENRRLIYTISGVKLRKNTSREIFLKEYD